MAKILVVDDNATNREFLVTLLGYGGHEMSEAADGAEAARAVEANRPDLVISDILMPVADGYEFVRQVRANPAVAATPVIFYTAAYHRQEAEPLASAATGVRFLSKPSEPEVILLVVDAALRGEMPATADGPPDVEYDREHMRLLTDKLARKVLELEREIAERKLAEAERDAMVAERAARIEAERQGRIKDEFLATLSHELRTPLNAILGWSQVLQGSTDAEDMREGLEVIGRNARVQQQIIEDLLDMSRIISGKVRLDVQRIDLGSCVSAAVDTVRHAAEAKGIRLQPVIDPAVGSVTGDPARLQQVFWNLLTNAVKFTPKLGRIQVTVERVNSHVEVSVADSGEGIQPEFLPLVFDRFRQADGSTTRRHGGLGLGLSIVKQLVELHGGSVRVRSPGPGHGSTFSVELPLAIVHLDPSAAVDERRHPAARPTTAWSAAAAGVKLTGVTVLVIDDEPDARGLLQRLLADCDAAVVAAASVAEGLSLAHAHRPQVIVSDIGMPVEDGYAFIARLRASADGPVGRTPCVALTAYARSEDRTRAILAGYQMHLAKPVEPAELVAMVASLAGRAGVSPSSGVAATA